MKKLIVCLLFTVCFSAHAVELLSSCKISVEKLNASDTMSNITSQCSKDASYIVTVSSGQNGTASQKYDVGGSEQTFHVFPKKNNYEKNHSYASVTIHY